MTEEELDKLEVAIEKKSEYLAAYNAAYSWDEENDLDEKLLSAARVYLAEQRQGGGAVDLLERPYMVDYEPTLGELTTLWDVVVRQDTPELQASFTVNYLRGVIKISPEIKGRLRADHLAAQRQAPVDSVAMDVLRVFDKARKKQIGWLSFSNYIWDNAETIRAALTNSVPGEAMKNIEMSLFDARAAFAVLRHNKPDDHPYHLLFENCDKALRELEPWVKGVE